MTDDPVAKPAGVAVVDGSVPDGDKPGERYYRHSIKKLRLNLEEAAKGRTWLLLPEGFRAADCGTTYPLPCRRHELQKLAAIDIPLHKMDSGCLYLRRALKQYKHLQARTQSATFDTARRAHAIEKRQWNYNQRVRTLEAEAAQAVVSVQEKAADAIASLTDLFDLGRKGLSGMMQAHLAGNEWQGEQISGSAFRDCFRMVTQAVKGLGLPSDQRPKATASVMSEVAAALKGTHEALMLGNEPEDGESTQ